ncbi:carboxypeptidase regulatory-like domain-containing protein [Bremerella sp. JC817]|uniref:carboxypeptidase regulatory-like domain-containing protein n=1 Tax=Bremerella sp. JC817 TaxID=3231756 RepID=UPI00345AD24A
MSVSQNTMFAFLSIGLISGLGCSSELPPPENMPELHPVTLTIVQEGTPLELASIRLIPDAAPSPWYSGGSTNASGVSKIRTHGKFNGVPAGTYRVTVTKIEMPQAGSGSLAEMNQTSAQDATYDLVDPQYSNPAKTPLRLEVVAGSNTKEFDLGVPVRVKRKGPPR